MLKLTCFSFVLVASVLVVHSPGQQTASGTDGLTFEVASIHESKPGAVNGGIKALTGGNGYTAQNVPVKLMIALMYRIPMRQISGAPEWLNGQPYDVEAKADKPGYSIEELHTMYQNMLAERFKLKFHVEHKEGNVYALKQDKGGAKIGSGMKVNTSPQNYDIPITFGPGGAALGVRVPMPYFCWFLGQRLQDDARPVVDMTGLDGFYDFTLDFQPVLPPGVNRENLPPELADKPSLFDALKQQLGLTLIAQRGPVEYLVIDHVEKPSEN